MFKTNIKPSNTHQGLPLEKTGISTLKFRAASCLQLSMFKQFSPKKQLREEMSPEQIG